MAGYISFAQWHRQLDNVASHIPLNFYRQIINMRILISSFVAV